MSTPDDAHTGTERDPTRVSAQPALTTTSGTTWVVVAALLAAASAFPLSALLIIDPGESFPLAVVIAVVIVLLLITVIVLRLVVAAGPRRLRALAWCTGALAAVALIGLFVCADVGGGRPGDAVAHRGRARPFRGRARRLRR